MNACALPKGDSQSLSRQGTLDGNVVVQPRVPPFTTAGLLDYVFELVVYEDEVCPPCFNVWIIISQRITQAFQLVDRGSFHRLIKYCRPSLSDADIPHCMTLRKEILTRTKVVEERVKEELKVYVYKKCFHSCSLIWCN
jgi:hypothetical protein